MYNGYRRFDYAKVALPIKRMVKNQYEIYMVSLACFSLEELALKYHP
jgi:hypothetical protein